MYSTETDFYLRQQREDRRWTIAVLLAVAVHAAVVLLVMFTPSFFQSRPIVEEVVSVSLISMTDSATSSAPADSAPPPAAKPPAAEKKVEPPPPSPPPKSEPPPERAAPPEKVPPPPKVQVPPTPEVAPPKPEAPTNPVSIFPDKRKIKKAQDTRLEEEKVKEKEVLEKKQEDLLKKKMEELKQQAQKREQEEHELEKKVQERQREAERKEVLKREEERKKAAAQARLDQIRAENEARQAQEEAKQLADAARAAQDALAKTRSDAARQTQALQKALTQTTAGRQGAKSIASSTYGQAASDKIKRNWKLPDTRSWDANLSANVVILVNRNGELLSLQFDKKSGDPQFDKLVEQTIHKALPLPPFPAVMTEDSTEVPCNFNVRELGN